MIPKKKPNENKLLLLSIMLLHNFSKSYLLDIYLFI